MCVEISSMCTPPLRRRSPKRRSTASAQLYRVEETIKGAAPDHRRRERRQRSKPIAEALAVWADATARKLSRKSELAAAFRYMRARWAAFGRCFDDGRLALDNNPAERAPRCVATRRSLSLFFKCL